ncbi:rab-GTPase-TBC domain-containing protein [Lentinula raphanica]|nr:rab-GTPase-TBC domain-containing protein [Lentinula raphanica]KAJ3969572.1 rab-GTPase-TBC domain-containing protein [Lentinula raphanica]
MVYDKTFWQEARQKSLQPGGFGEDRIYYWPKLLNVDLNDGSSIEIDIDTLPAHPDEQQIRLDTDRSFVMYPDGDVQGHQQSLNELLVSIFRRHPSLSYFQGYHDIITVLFLTLPPSLRFPCAEKVSLHWTRDAMGDGLEPVLGLLRFLAKLIAAVDVELAKLLKRVAPLPYFALSNLLTMFAHNVPTLPLIQHVFDYLLARPPIALVYLTAAVILSRKDELLAFDQDEDGDLGMLHSLLGVLPQMTDEPTPSEVVADCKEGSPPVAVEFSRESMQDLSAPDTSADMEVQLSNVSADETDTDTIVESESIQDTETVLDSDVESEPAKLVDLVSSPNPSLGLSLPDPSPLQTSVSESLLNDTNMALSRTPTSRSPSPIPLASQSSLHSSIHDSSNSISPAQNLSSSSSSFQTQSHIDDLESFRRVKQAPIPLLTLLRDADKLLEAYPPYQNPSNVASSSSSSSSSASSSSPPPPSSASTPPPLASVLADILGPSSVVYTWSEDPAQLPPDDEAESMVKDPSKIVFPWDPSLNEDGDNSEEDEQNEKETTSDSYNRRRRFMDRSLLLRRPELMLSAGAGAVLVIAIALAMVGSRGNRGERVSLDKLLGLLGIWGTWGWNWINR